MILMQMRKPKRVGLLEIECLSMLEVECLSRISTRAIVKNY